jgi:hypothetical protein
MEVFIKILEEKKMNFVLKRLKLYQKMQFIGKTKIMQIVHFILKPSVEFEYTIRCYDYGLNSSII